MRGLPLEVEKAINAYRDECLRWRVGDATGKRDELTATLLEWGALIRNTALKDAAKIFNLSGYENERAAQAIRHLMEVSTR